MQRRRVQPKTGPAKKRPRLGVLIVFGSVACLGLLLLVVGLSEPGRQTSRTRDRVKLADDSQKRPVSSRTTPATNASEATSHPSLLEDDGKTLWVSPTDGPPIDTTYLPPGVTFIVALRPESIASHDEGEKLFDPDWPASKRILDVFANDVPTIPGVELVIIGISVDSNGSWGVTQVLHISGGKTATEYVQSEFPSASKQSHNGRDYWLHGERAYFVPTADGMTLVVTSPSAIGDIIDLAGSAPPLRRDVERLLAHTDADRHVTIMFTPNSLFSEGRGMFQGEMAGMRQPLFWFLGDELSAAALSLHWDENFFVELTATPTLDTPPEQASRILASRMAEIPDRLEAYVVGLQPQPYGRMVIARFPAMVRTLSAYTRSGFDSEHVTMNAYLPAVAGHNLLMGAELTLAESLRPVAEATSPGDGSPLGAGGGARTLEEKLERPTSLKFARDTLDAALAQLSKDIGVAISIRGPDLQADGITKNQSFGIDIENKPAEEILLEILRLANPDKTAAGPNDVKQKLVYVVDKDARGGGQIVVTTRGAAVSRGEELPAVFQEESSWDSQ
jgi:hypothetical protein